MHRSPLVVISDERHGSVEEERAVLAPLGMELRVEHCVTSDDIAARCADADAVLLNLAPMDGKAIASLKRCKVISRYGVGLDNVDQRAAEASGIAVRNVKGYCDDEVAEHALGLLLALVRGIPRRDREVKAGGWNVAGVQRSLRRSVIGVAGFGGSGRAFARRALALCPAELAVWSPHCDQAELEAELGQAAAALGVRLRRVSFGELCSNSDALSLHLKLCEETRGLFSRETLYGMKRGAYIINCARGALLDTDALADALADGILAGAGLDVFEPEPPPGNHPLLSRDNVIVTDHCAYRSDRSIAELKRRCALNAAEVLLARKS